MGETKLHKKRNGHAKPVSLYPLSFDAALTGLLETKPPPKKQKPQTKKKEKESQGQL